MTTENNQKGFTLIELMVVIVIVGILSAVALPSIFNMTAKAKLTEVVVIFGTFQRFADMHFQTQGELPKSFAEMGLELPNGNYFELTELYEENVKEEAPLPGAFKKTKAG